MRAAVLTGAPLTTLEPTDGSVSDTAARDASADRSGPALRAILESKLDGLSRPIASVIVPDDVEGIRQQVRAWAADGPDRCALIITTGGTGLSPRDVTPEALAPLLARSVPGVAHAMMAASLKVTPMAALARPVCGVTETGTLVLALPGSPKGAVENLEAVLSVLPHALDLISGGTGRAVHTQMQGSHAHHHHHHGHHAPKPRTAISNTPGGSAAARQRQSPWPIIAMDDALALIFEHTHRLPTVELPLRQLRGHVIADDIIAAADIPSGPSTNVDGYAVRAADPAGVYPISTSRSYPQPMASHPLPPGQIYRINTGALLPPGADAVVMVEDTLVAETDAAGEEVRVEVLAQVDAGENVRKQGSDVRKGERVLEAGTVISDVGGELGTLAFVGRRSASVYRKPVVAILSTGNELCDLADPSSSGAIADSNRPSLQLALEAAGYSVVDLGIAVDDADATERALRRGLEQADVVVATGGTSMGELDLLKPVIERRLDGTIHFGRVAVKPGKPTTFATVAEKLIFALPGNPASALCTLFVFVFPALRKLRGRLEAKWRLPSIRVQIDSAMRLDPRPEFHRVHVRTVGDLLVASSTGGQRSSRTVSLAHANALVCLPAGKGQLEAGAMVEAILVGSLDA